MSGVKSGGGGGGGAAGGAGGAASTDAAAVPALDKAKFSSVVKLTAVRVEARKTAAAMKALGGSLLKMPRVKTVVDMGGSSPHRLVLLAKQFAPDKEGIDGLPEEHRDFVKSQALSTETYELRLGYDDLGVDEVLRELLPPHLDVPSSFESAGHLAHLNLRDGHEPYRFLIGQVVLDKNKRLRTVVNKVGQIHAEFRTFDMELLAGEPDFEVTLKESGATFTFNFKDVYWNSRLQMEHRRMIEAFTKDDVVCDMFCGVGPFAVPMGMRGTRVHANDLNPRSFEYLKLNVRRNGSAQDFVTCYNLDAREFVRKLVAEGIAFNHVLMNLPTDAIEFLDCFVGLFPEGTSRSDLPIIHTYCFAKAQTGAERRADVVRRINKVLGAELSADAFDIRVVRDVAPRKEMFCVTFRLPLEVGVRCGSDAAGAEGGAGGGSPPPAKRLRAGES